MAPDGDPVSDTGSRQGKDTQILFGLVTEKELAAILAKLPEGATHIAATKILIGGGDPADDAPPQQITSDIYVGSDQHTHVVIGVIQPDGTWEILSDTTIPF